MVTVENDLLIERLATFFFQSHDIENTQYPAEAVLTSTHNLCFGEKNKKNRYTPAYCYIAI